MLNKRRITIQLNVLGHIGPVLYVNNGWVAIGYIKQEKKSQFTILREFRIPQVKLCSLIEIQFFDAV